MCMSGKLHVRPFWACCAYMCIYMHSRMMRIKVPWVSEPCRFAKSCRLYRSDSHTCNDDDEAISYCGYSLHWD